MKILTLWIRRYSTKKLEKILLSMPKDATEHVQTNQRHRLRIKEKSKFYSPGTVNIQVLGSGARGTSSSVYIFSEQSR
jgi:ribonuclease Z